VLFDGNDITAMRVPQRVIAGLGCTYQIPSLCLDFSALRNVALSVQAHDGHSFWFWPAPRRMAGWEELALQWLERVGLRGREHVLAGELAHGEQRKLEIAVALAGNPRVLLLDEPMAGIAGREAEELVALLESLKGAYTLVMVEHDMDAVFRLADRVSVLVYGRCIATDAPAAIRDNDEVRRAYLG
jgi:branched-chain amino acid transport system ATP-binding protein